MNCGGMQMLALFLSCLSCLSLVSVGAGITIEPLNGQHVNEGDTVILDCILQNVRIWSDVFIFWYHDGQAVAVNMGLAVLNPNYQLNTNTIGHYKLTIQQAQIEDQGLWKCSVQVPSDVWQDMRLDVFAPPIITSVTRDMTPQPGSTVALWCNATGSPEPTVTWTRQRPLGLLPSGREFMTGNPVVITDITNSWRGIYQCHVSNGISEKVVTGAVFLQMEYAPMVEVVNDLVSAPLGKTANLQCIGQAFPAVETVDKIKWFKNDRLVDVNDGYQMSVDLDTMDPYGETSISMLVVNSVGPDTVGEYTCRFENTLGDAEGRVMLEVGKTVNPDTGKSINGASTIMASILTNIAIIAVATTLM